MRRMAYFILMVSFLLINLVAVAFGKESSSVHNDHIPSSQELPISQNQAFEESKPTVGWTSWGSDFLEMVEDGDYVWITGSYGARRVAKDGLEMDIFNYSTGFPFGNVYSIVVDNDGNRWFSTDVGLSRLDSADNWLHLCLDPNGAPFHQLAVNADGTVWVKGLGNGAVYRRGVDGSWKMYANEVEAIEADFDDAVSTVRTSTLWLAAGNEVWLDSGFNLDVYDGVEWHDRRPFTLNGPIFDVRVHPDGTVWAAQLRQSFITSVLFHWQDDTWYEYGHSAIDARALALDISPNGDVWVGHVGRDIPHSEGYNLSRYDPTLNELIDVTGINYLTSYILATQQDVWTLTPMSVRIPSRDAEINATPTNSDVDAVFTDHQGRVWVHDVFVDRDTGETIVGTLEAINDQGTLSNEDDLWSFSTSIEMLTDVEVVLDNSIWATGYYLDYWGNIERVTPKRFIDGEWVAYYAPGGWSEAIVEAIFAESERRTWFYYRVGNWIEGYSQYVYSLDDGGTPLNFDDDVWTQVALPDTVYIRYIAVDSLGRIWFASGDGIYRYDNGDWQQLSYLNYSDITVAPDGTIYAKHEDKVVTFAIDGTRTDYQIDELIRSQPDLIRTIRRQSALWTIAPDESIWWWSGDVLRRLAPDGVETELPLSMMPFTDVDKSNIAVDEYNHVWFATEDDLWRWAPFPDYALTERLWFADPEVERRVQIEILNTEGFEGPVTLSLVDLPDGVTVQLDEYSVPAGGKVWGTISAESTIPPGIYHATLIGESATSTRIAPITIVVGHISDFYMPHIRQ